MTLGQNRSDFSPPDSYGLIDIHQGYYPMVMKWHWATAGRRSRDGRLVGFNLTDNQVEDQHAYNENCVWRDGRLSPLPPVTFHFDRRYPFQLADAVEGGILPRHVFGAVPFEEWATHDWSAAAILTPPVYRNT